VDQEKKKRPHTTFLPIDERRRGGERQITGKKKEKRLPIPILIAFFTRNQEEEDRPFSQRIIATERRGEEVHRKAKEKRACEARFSKRPFWLKKRQALVHFFPLQGEKEGKEEEKSRVRHELCGGESSSKKIRRDPVQRRTSRRAGRKGEEKGKGDPNSTRSEREPRSRFIRNVCAPVTEVCRIHLFYLGPERKEGNKLL